MAGDAGCLPKLNLHGTRNSRESSMGGLNVTDEEKELQKSLLERAADQIRSRKGGYGPDRRENSFPFIARRIQVWLKNNFDIDVNIEDWMCADLMVEFKRGRAEARRAAGVPRNPDDPEDAVAYMQWVDWLFDGSAQLQIAFAQIGEEDESGSDEEIHYE